MTLSAEQRQALEMLADAGARGSTLDMLVTNGFPAELLAGLVSDGLAIMQGETVKVDERTSEIIRVIITDAGQSVIEDRQKPNERALQPKERAAAASVSLPREVGQRAPCGPRSHPAFMWKGRWFHCDPRLRRKLGCRADQSWACHDPV
jgi:hypothetical protein